MSDKRIRTYQTYREEGDRAERVYVKRVNNTIPTLHPPNSQGIFNLGNTSHMQSIPISTDSSSKPSRTKF